MSATWVRAEDNSWVRSAVDAPSTESKETAGERLQDSDGSNLDPHIRQTVARLRSWGFETTDSGDGRSKFLEGTADETTLTEPHVFCRVDPDKMNCEARKMIRLLKEHAAEARVEATYWPEQEV